jgi:hypothetical protein
MAPSISASLGKEVQDYLRCCEHLLAAAIAPNTPPFSREELVMLEYYADEVAKIVAVLAKK